MSVYKFSQLQRDILEQMVMGKSSATEIGPAVGSYRAKVAPVLCEVENIINCQRLGKVAVEWPDDIQGIDYFLDYFGALSRKEKLVLQYRIDGLDQNEIGAILGIGRARVSQMESNAIERICRADVDWPAEIEGLEEYIAQWQTRYIRESKTANDNAVSRS